MARHDLVVTIDGPSGAGKSTVARRVAQTLGFTLLDTGAIYRTLALAAHEQQLSWDDADRLASLAATLPLRFVWLDGQHRVFLGDRDVSAEIRSPAMSLGASQVSKLPAVRQALLRLQQEFARRGPLVVEGRDTGTVVFPQAQVKVFLIADPDERIRRRFSELKAAGGTVTLDEVRRAELARDAADTQRDASPLRQAPDAEAIDTTGLSIDQVVARIVQRCQQISPQSIDDR